MPRELSIQGNKLILPAAAVDDEACNALSPHAVDKLRHLHRICFNFNKKKGDAPLTEEWLIFACRSSQGAIVRNIRAGLAESGTATSVTFDLWKYPANASILSSVIPVLNGTGDFNWVLGSINSPLLAANDWLAIKCDITGGATAATGPMIVLEVDELYS